MQDRTLESLRNLQKHADFSGCFCCQSPTVWPESTRDEEVCPGVTGVPLGSGGSAIIAQTVTLLYHQWLWEGESSGKVQELAHPGHLPEKKSSSTPLEPPETLMLGWTTLVALNLGAFLFLLSKAYPHFLSQRWDIPWRDERKLSWLHSSL